MPEDITKRVNVTFGTGLPLGEHARFKHDSEFWIAFPARKNAQIFAVTDKLIGIYSGMLENVVRFLNSHPHSEETELVVSMLGSIARARKVYAELLVDKTKARTS